MNQVEEKMRNKIYGKFLVLLFLIIMSGVIISTKVLAATNDVAYGKLNAVLLNQDPDPAEPGKYVELRWKITKEGSGALNEISFQLDNKYPFKIDNSEDAVKVIDDWSGYAGSDEYYILYYKVLVDPAAIEGDYDLVLLMNVSSTTVEKKFTIHVDDANNPELVTGVIRTNPLKLMPDSTDNQVSVELLNLGKDDAELVVATLNLPKGFENTYSYSSIASLGTVAGGSSKAALFFIDLNKSVREGSYPATLTLKYREEGENTILSKELPINLEVKNKPRFEIIGVDYNPTVILSGDSATISITIKNVGSKDADSVSVRAFKESSQPFDFDEKSDFVGTLKAGQEGTAIITLNVDKDADSKEYLMDIEIRSLYNGDVFTQNDVIKVDIVSKKSGFISKYWGIILAVIVVIIILVYLTLKKK